MKINFNRSSVPFVIALLLIVLGVVFLIENLTSVFVLRPVMLYWPVIILIIGVFAIVRGVFNNIHGLTASPWVWIGEGVFALFIICLGLTANFLVSQHWDLSIFEPPLVSAKTSKSGKLKFSGKEIDIENKIGNIKVTGWDKQEVKYTLKVISRGATMKSARRRLAKNKNYFEVINNKNKLKIKINQPYKFINTSCSANIILKIPKKTALDLKGLTDISVNDIDNKIKLASNIGKVNIGNINGSIITSSNVGGTFMKEVAGDIKVHSNTGDILIENPKGMLKAYSSTGDIGIKSNISLLKDWHLISNTGDIRIFLPPKASFWLDLFSQTGEINFNTKKISIKTGSSNGIGERIKQSVNGGGKLLYVRSNTGSIIFK